MQKNQFLKVKDSLLELEKYFIELKDREVNIKREIEEWFFKPVIVSIDEISLNKNKWRKEGQLKTLGLIG